MDNQAVQTKPWGYLEPLVPSEHVQRINFYEPCKIHGVSLGRGTHNDFVFTGGAVSNTHATIHWNGKRDKTSIVTLTDSSTNGTFIDGTKVEGTHQLFDGSVVFFGCKVPVVGHVADHRYTFHHPFGRPKDETVFTHYIMGPPLGAGSHGNIFRATEKTSGMVWAIKTARRNPLRNETIACAGQETMALMLLNHRNICKLHEVFFRNDGEFIDIVLELVQGITLQDLVVYNNRRQQLNDDQVREIAFQSCSAISYMHTEGVSHGDLKPDNIMITYPMDDAPIIKVVDFGLSRAIGYPNAAPMFSKSIYSAPEAIAQFAQYHSTGAALPVASSKLWDDWAIGCILYHLCTYTHPERCPERSIDLGTLSGRSEEAVDLIGKFLVLDPPHRTTATGALKHPWLSGYRPYQVPFAPELFEKPIPEDDMYSDMDIAENRNPVAGRRELKGKARAHGRRVFAQNRGEPVPASRLMARPGPGQLLGRPQPRKTTKP